MNLCGGVYYVHNLMRKHDWKMKNFFCLSISPVRRKSVPKTMIQIRIPRHCKMSATYHGTIVAQIMLCSLLRLPPPLPALYKLPTHVDTNRHMFMEHVDGHRRVNERWMNGRGKLPHCVSKKPLQLAFSSSSFLSSPPC